MKQYITEEQYNELSENQKKTWEKSMRNKGYTMEKVYGPPGQYWPFIPDSILNFPSIGEMLEFLGDHTNGIYSYPVIEDEDGKKYLQSKYINGNTLEDLCDWLWEAVKEILEK